MEDPGAATVTSASWHILHVDLAAVRPEVPAGAWPLFVIFWWRSLPLGVKTYAPEQLPVAGRQIDILTAEFASAQLAARSSRFGGPARASRDGRPVMIVPLASLEPCGDLLAELDAIGDPSPTSAQDLAVIVCTRDRPEALAGCLAGLAAQRSAPGEIIVIDNSGACSAERVARRVDGVRYIHEPRPGLSAARNAGIRASRCRLVAFTDDDAEPRANWTGEIVRAFSSADVEAVTGMVLPARLETHAQSFFQFAMGGLVQGCVPLVFDGRFFAETCPMGAQVWRIGAGANMAFRRSLFERIGLFDERLGAGASGCSEDSELWYRLLAGGGACLFEPRAVVLHHHREEWSELRSQMRAYMKGHVSALFVQATRYGHSGNLRRIFRQLPAYFARTAFEAVRDGRLERLQILGEEVLGWISGLQYSLRPGWRARGVPAMGTAPVALAVHETAP